MQLTEMQGLDNHSGAFLSAQHGAHIRQLQSVNGHSINRHHNVAKDKGPRRERGAPRPDFADSCHYFSAGADCCDHSAALEDEANIGILLPRHQAASNGRVKGLQQDGCFCRGLRSCLCCVCYVIGALRRQRLLLLMRSIVRVFGRKVPKWTATEMPCQRAPERTLYAAHAGIRWAQILELEFDRLLVCCWIPCEAQRRIAAPDALADDPEKLWNVCTRSIIDSSRVRTQVWLLPCTHG